MYVYDLLFHPRRLSFPLGIVSTSDRMFWSPSILRCDSVRRCVQPVFASIHQAHGVPQKTHPELLAPIEYDHIREVTSQMHDQISSGTIDAPSWGLVRTAKLTARMYAPLGTRMRLGDYIRVTRAFLEVFKSLDDSAQSEAAKEQKKLLQDLNVSLPYVFVCHAKSLTRV